MAKKKPYQEGDVVRFSNSTLGTLRECPRCFWLEQKHGIKRPRGIFPSLPGGVDRVLKTYFDKHMRAGTLPPEMVSLDGAIPYPDREKMELWRNWRNLIIDVADESGVVVAQLSGALDELILWQETGLCSPYDYKTRGAPPVEGASEGYYGSQLDIYHFLVEEGCTGSRGIPLKCNGDGYLGYYWPKDVTGHGDFKFETTVVKLSTDPRRARQLVLDGVACLALQVPPPPAFTSDAKGKMKSCEYCDYVTRHSQTIIMMSAPAMDVAVEEPAS